MALADGAQRGVRESVAALVARAAGEWLGLAVADDAVLAAIEDKLPAGVALDEALARLDIAEIYIACACATGANEALAAFEARYFPEIDRVVARMRLPATARDELRQELRHKLFLGSPPPILKYAGAGTLGALIRVASTRAAISAARKDRPRDDVDDETVAEILGGSVDPKLEAVTRECRSAVKTAFEDAVRELESRERNVLRMHLVDHLTVDEIGNVYGVNRATAARWLVRVRETLAAEVRRLLADRLKVEAEELESIVRAARSGLELSFSRVLAS
jgi:RNA polymerase sigma-70 factor (ECF subfamily)